MFLVEKPVCNRMSTDWKLDAALLLQKIEFSLGVIHM